MLIYKLKVLDKKLFSIFAANIQKHTDMNTQELSGKTCILYARCSTNEKQQSTKIQLEQLEAFCKKNEITINKKFSENVSGAKEHREQLETILNSEPMADLLIIREISRISRESDYMEALDKVKLLSKKYSIYVLLDDYYIKKGEVIDLATGITMMVKLYGAADERKKILDRTSTARDKYRQNPINVATGTKFIPFGLMKDDNPNYQKGVNTKKIWVKNPDEWAMVEKIFELKCEGYSLVKISQITGVSLNIVQQTIKNPKIRYYISDTVLAKCDEATAKNNSCPSPTKHINLYKNKIFVCDTKYAMIHQCTKQDGSQYRAKKGWNGVLKSAIIDDVVKKTIIAMLVFFDLKKQELAQENEAKIKQYEEESFGLMKTVVAMAKNEEELNRKWLKAPNTAIEEMIAKEIESNRAEIRKITFRVDYLNGEINRLRSIDYSGASFTISDTNFPDFIDKYIRKIECWYEAKNTHLIKVFVNPEFIPSNYFDYKMWKVYTHKTYKVEEVSNPEAAQTVYSNGGFSWDCKYHSLPYYNPEEIAEMFGNQN